MRIAIIDDGVDTSFFKKKCIRLKVDNQKVIANHNEQPAKLTHSTIILGIIDEWQTQPNKHEYINIKIMEPEQLTTQLQSLITALNWCLHNSIDLIHLSIGSTLYYDKYQLKTILNKIEKQGVVIVAALSNEYKISYPASLSGVIGVKYSDSLNECDIQFNPNPLDGIEISTGCKDRIFEHDIIPCNSYAAATITGMILKSFSVLNTSAILSYFRKKSNDFYNVKAYSKYGDIYNVPCIKYTSEYSSDLKSYMASLNKKFSDYGYHSIVITPNYQNISNDIFAILQNFREALNQLNRLVYMSDPDLVLIDSCIVTDCCYVDFDIIIKSDSLNIFNMDFRYDFQLPKTETMNFVVEKILKCYHK